MPIAPSRWMVKEMRRNLRGRVVLVTGASRGIGRRTAERLAKLGARLALTARSAEDLAKVAGECRAAGVEVEVIPGDLTRPTERERIVAATVDRFGALDVLANSPKLVASGPLVPVGRKRGSTSYSRPYGPRCDIVLMIRWASSPKKC